MNIRAILAKPISLLEREKKFILDKIQLVKENKVDYEWCYEIIRAEFCCDFEYELSRHDLDVKLTKETLQPFKELLARRWTKIKNGIYAYPGATHFNFINIYIAIADALSPIYQINKHQLLMPTLTVATNHITSTSLDDPSLQFNHYVLSEDIL